MDTSEIVMLVICGLAFVLTIVVPKRGTKKMRGIEQTMMQLPEYVAVNPQDYAHLDLLYYDTTRAELEAVGCRFVGDVGDKRLEKAFKALRSFLRVLVSSDGSEQIAIYHVKPIGAVGLFMRLIGVKEHYVTEVETELSDGRFLVTTTVERRNLFSQPTQFSFEHLEPGTPPRRVLFLHSERVVRELREHPGIQTVAITTLDDALASQLRGAKIKSAHRHKLGGFTREEITALAPKGTVGDASKLYDDLVATREREGADRNRSNEPGP